MKDYYNKVKEILWRYPATRDDDMMLYAKFCVDFSYIRSDEPFYQVLCTAKKRKIPSFESVTRARRKVQELEPALRGEKRQRRKAEEATYRDYYGNH